MAVNPHVLHLLGRHQHGAPANGSGLPNARRGVVPPPAARGRGGPVRGVRPRCGAAQNDADREQRCTEASRFSRMKTLQDLSRKHEIFNCVLGVRDITRTRGGRRSLPEPPGRCPDPLPNRTKRNGNNPKDSALPSFGLRVLRNGCPWPSGPPKTDSREKSQETSNQTKESSSERTSLQSDPDSATTPRERAHLSANTLESRGWGARGS